MIDPGLADKFNFMKDAPKKPLDTANIPMMADGVTPDVKS